MRWLSRFWSEASAETTTTKVIFIALGCVAGVAILGDLGYHLYQYFHAVGSCLNGC